MAISFNSVPNNIRIPFVAVEFDNTRAQQGPALMPYRGLIIGQKTSGGSASANTLHRVTSAAKAMELAGRGSMLALMAAAWLANNSFTEMYIGVLADDAGGTAMTKTLTFTGPATGAGKVYLYVGDDLVAADVAAGDTADDVAAAVVAAIGDNADLPVTAAVGAEPNEHVVTLTFRHKGTVGNGLSVRLNYQDGEALPAGVGCTIAAGATGATDPSLSSLIAAMGDTWFHVIAHPYTADTPLDAIEAELASRNGPMRMIDGVAVTASNETHSGLGTLGDSRNSPHSCIVATNQSPTAPYEIAAEVGALLAYYGNIDPARPFHTLALAQALPPAEADRFTDQERNLLLFDGISTLKPAAGGRVQIERVITTYQTNGAGAPDESYLAVNRPLTLMYLRYSFRTRMMQRYPRHKLTNDGTRIAAGQAFITPKIGKAEAVTWFREMEELGLVENFDQFKNDLVVERNAQNADRLDFLLPTDMVNQFIVAGVQIQFRI